MSSNMSIRWHSLGKELWPLNDYTARKLSIKGSLQLHIKEPIWYSGDTSNVKPCMADLFLTGLGTSNFWSGWQPEVTSEKSHLPGELLFSPCGLSSPLSHFCSTLNLLLLPATAPSRSGRSFVGRSFRWFLEGLAEGSVVALSLSACCCCCCLKAPKRKELLSPLSESATEGGVKFRKGLVLWACRSFSWLPEAIAGDGKGSKPLWFGVFWRLVSDFLGAEFYKLSMPVCCIFLMYKDSIEWSLRAQMSLWSLQSELDVLNLHGIDMCTRKLQWFKILNFCISQTMAKRGFLLLNNETSYS